MAAQKKGGAHVTFGTAKDLAGPDGKPDKAKVRELARRLKSMAREASGK